MNVFYFCSDLFVQVAAVSIVSLMENNKNSTPINFYIIDDGIRETNKKQLEQIISSYGNTIFYIEAPDPSEILDFPFKSRYQIGHSYPRMCIGTLLPNDVEKVLCLDSDTLILHSLKKLWNLDIGNNIMAGVSDCVNLKAFKRQFMLDNNHIYCNAGMFLVNLKKWRDEHVEDSIKKIIKRNNGNVFFFEQTLMNLSCKGKIYKLHPRYNTYTLFYGFTYKNLMKWRNPTTFYSEEEVNKAKKNPYIIHFTRNFYMLSRPWVKNCDHPLAAKYMEYKQCTPWTELEEDNRSILQKRQYKLIHKLPQNLLVHITNFLYNGLRPYMFWKNE